jgi:hypothetical protein
MKHDPEVKTKSEPLTVEAFIRWLEINPVDREYEWHDVEGCLLCLYLREVFGVQSPAGETWNGVGGFGKNTLNGDFKYFAICGEKPWTFGAALERARKLQQGA